MLRVTKLICLYFLNVTNLANNHININCAKKCLSLISLIDLILFWVTLLPDVISTWFYQNASLFWVNTFSLSCNYPVFLPLSFSRHWLCPSFPLHRAILGIETILSLLSLRQPMSLSGVAEGRWSLGIFHWYPSLPACDQSWFWWMSTVWIPTSSMSPNHRLLFLNLCLLPFHLLSTFDSTLWRKSHHLKVLFISWQ